MVLPTSAAHLTVPFSSAYRPVQTSITTASAITATISSPTRAYTVLAAFTVIATLSTTIPSSTPTTSSSTSSLTSSHITAAI